MNEIEEKGFELKYAPRKCKHFCCGDCVITMKSCFNDDEKCGNFEDKSLFTEREE